MSDGGERGRSEHRESEGIRPGGPVREGRLFVPHVEDLRLALAEPRVLAALQQSLRDIRLRAAFWRLRSEGHAVATVVEQLCGPHYDVEGRAYYLSAERVRSIVYEKGSASDAASFDAAALDAAGSGGREMDLDAGGGAA